MSKPVDSAVDYRRVRLRLTAAWALSEGLLGGLLHALKVPFTGLVVGSAAVICLCLLGWYRDRPGHILRATLVVLVVKAVLSPHAPLPAYIAVLFQGMVAEVVLRGRATHRLACVVLGALALVESAVQKLLVLTLLFGKTIWQAADAFLSSLLQQFGFVPAAYAERLAAGYVGLHVVVGLAVGWWAGRLVRLEVRGQKCEVPLGNTAELVVPPSVPLKPAPRWVWKAGWGAVLLALLIWEPAWLPRHDAVRLILRAGAVLVVWYWLLGPVLARWLRGWLARQRHHRLAADVDTVLALLPEMRALFRRAWRDSAGAGAVRWLHFVRLATGRVVSDF